MKELDKFLLLKSKNNIMPNLYIYECECQECGYTWKSTPMQNPPSQCSECESNDINVLNKTQVSSV